jgi:hypothetical protein
LDSTQWDLILCSLSSWIQSVDETWPSIKKAAAATSGGAMSTSGGATFFSVAAIRLAASVAVTLDG